MKPSDFETPFILLIAICIALFISRLLEMYMNRPGARDGYFIKDKKGNKLCFEVLRSASEEERQRIFEEKTREFHALQAKREREASQPQAK